MSEKYPKTYALLKCNKPVYFVVEVSGYSDITEEETEAARFLYDEHTCPINWTGEIVAVIQDGDPDPHGFAEFVRLAKGLDDSVWLDIFPEVKPC